MRPPPTEIPFDENERPHKSWIEWIREDLFNMVSLDNGSGTTGERPVNGIKNGSRYWDTTLELPIWYDLDNTKWIDAAGNTV